MFTIPVALAIPVIYALASGDGAQVFLPTLGIAALALTLGGLTVWMAKRIIEHA